MKPIKIEIYSKEKNQFFLINNFIPDITGNKRLFNSLKRLNADFSENEIIIPFRSETKISLLDELQTLLVKFDFVIETSDEIKSEVTNFDRENLLFEEFTSKAFSIRNDEFKLYPDLVKDFVEFKESQNKHFKRKLYLLQELSAFHLSFAQNACNFAVPGAGKTSIVYSAYSFLKNLPIDNPKHVNKLVVIGPLSSFAPWENEYLECFGYTTSIQRLSGNSNISREKKLEHLYSGNPAEITLINHGGVESLQTDILEFLKKNKCMLVVDEAHRIKNPEGVWGQSVTNISKEAKARVILTGTPAPNGYEDLFNLFKFIYPFKYKTILNFHYQNLIDLTNSSTYDNERVQQLKNNISPFFIRIRKSDLNLPPVKDQFIQVEMGKNQKFIYDYIESEYIKTFRHNESATIKDIINRAKLIRLRQASSNPSLLAISLKDALANNFESDEFDPNSKFAINDDNLFDDSEFFKRITEYEKSEIPSKFITTKEITDKIIIEKGKVIIWTIFIQNAKQLKQYLKNNSIESKLLIGEIPQEEREEVIGKFNNPLNNEFQVVIANPFSVSESISLHKGCHNAIYLERDYNCTNFLQSKDRIHRVGLEKNQITNYYYLISNDSIDEVINERLQVKIERMERIINDDIPLFNRVNDDDETDIIKELVKKYASRT
jgi:SNF2 family DNA or RNA helicase